MHELYGISVIYHWRLKIYSYILNPSHPKWQHDDSHFKKGPTVVSSDVQSLILYENTSLKNIHNLLT
jgi:hypothetical protein